MKVIFNCGLYAFHRDHYKNIAKELERRGHVVEFAEDRHFYDADFTITADEAQGSLGGEVVWIGHSFDGKGAMWNDPHCLGELAKNADYAFVYSTAYKEILEKYFKKPIHVTGMTKLDGLYGRHGENILYAPTFDEELMADDIVGDTINELSKSGNVLIRRHPAHYSNSRGLDDVFSISNIVISGYSSTGMEAIVLDKPTILVNNPHRFEYKSFPPNSYICNQARNATIQVDNSIELLDAIKIYQERPSYLRKERKKYASLLCEYRGMATERAVDVLEELYEYRGNKKNK